MDMLFEAGIAFGKLPVPRGSPPMNEDGQFSNFTEVWINANRMRVLFLTSLLTSVTATAAEGWKLLHAQAASQQARSGSALERHDAPAP